MALIKWMFLMASFVFDVLLALVVVAVFASIGVVFFYAAFWVIRKARRAIVRKERKS